MQGTKLPQLRWRVSNMLGVRLFELVPVYKKHTIFALYCVAADGYHSLNEKQTILMKNHDIVRIWFSDPVLPQINQYPICVQYGWLHSGGGNVEDLKPCYAQQPVAMRE